MSSNIADRLRTVSRRQYLKGSGAAALTGLAGCAGGADGTGGQNGTTVGQANEKQYSMTFASPYTNKSSKYVPIAQEAFAKNVEEETDGRVSVDLAPAGELGSGSALAQKVQQGAIEAGLFSLSNWSPFVPEVDLINLPYLAGSNQEFVNLIRSDIWKNTILPTIRQKGYEPAYYVVVAPRSFATGPTITDPPTTPEQLAEMDITHRVNASDILQKAWNIVDANPSPVDWGETPSALRQGVVNSLHVSPEFLAAFGFENLVNHLVLISAVEDAQTVSMSRSWYTSLPGDVQDDVDRAARKTQQHNYNRIPQTQKNAYELFRSHGAEFHELSDSKLQKWKDAFGYQLDVWDPYKKRLAGSMERFQEFEKAIKTKADIDVPSGEI
ncbi:MAG: TRAP transporter substrate-binding protein DctP [Halodesulfurarchaeum sp.]